MHEVKIVCRALITNAEHAILFVKKTGSDFWSLPGGKLDPEDKDLQTCLKRELQEELGVKATIQAIRFVHELRKEEVRYVELIWDASIANLRPESWENPKILSNNELSHIQWIKPAYLSNENIKPDFLKNIRVT
jgi:8-oxo-dGTP pyrophosphatase MutT (NUDIX family)